MKRNHTKKQTKYSINQLCVILLVFIILFGIFLLFLLPNIKNQANDLPTANIETHTVEQKSLMEDAVIDSNKYPDGTAELSRPAPYVVNQHFNNIDSSIKTAELHLHENDKSTEPIIYNATIENDNVSCSLSTLSTSCTYYYQFVITTIANHEYKSEFKSFKTQNTSPANLYISGITNCRDIGGWKTYDGKVVKQRKIFRTSRLNENYTTNHLISKKGKETMLNDLKVKTEIDLRETTKLNGNAESGDITQSPLGEKVQYVSIPINTALFPDINSDHMRYSVNKIFQVVSNKNNYPIFYHCAIGRDRTGFITFLLNGLLGVSENDLYKDYLFSNFGKVGNKVFKETIENSYVKKIKQYDGNTLYDKIHNYLISCGVSNEEMTTFKEIML